MNITITLQANERLLTAIERIANLVSTNSTAPVKQPEGKPAMALVKEDPQETFPDNLDNETYDIAKVRAIASEASQAGKKDKIKGILKEMNVTRVTDLQENQFSDFVKKVKAL